MGLFGTELFDFLEELAHNNTRDWFEANRDRYEADVKEPCLEFIEAMAGPLHEISPHFRAIPKTQGGSMFRIHRDTRFSADKTPYKTNAALQFRHERAKDAHAPGYYLHLEPDSCFAGVGLWAPETKVQYAIRAHIDEHRDEWVSAKAALDGVFTVDPHNPLKRPPKGYEADDPLIEDLKLRSFIAMTSLDEATVTSDDFLPTYVGMIGHATPFMGFLCAAVGVDF
ncbi:MAG: TIGR02453 family protein [Acidimicrobiia bacterium]